MRTGTSMMMKALEAGGLEAEYQQSRDVMKNRHADEHYDPNIGGLYELRGADYKHPNFPRMYGNKLIKGLNQCVPSMKVMDGGIRVIFMRRDSEEIRQSYNAFFSNHINIGEQFQNNLDEVVKSIRNRKDVISCTELQYREIVEHPLEAFAQLKFAGWPINPKKAAKVVDPQYFRFRTENLEVGVM